MWTYGESLARVGDVGDFLPNETLKQTVRLDVGTQVKSLKAFQEQEVFHARYA
jgi:hypothetical protein